MTEHLEPPQNEIREALRQLPRVSASQRFNRNLLAQLGRPTRPLASVWPRLAAAGLVLAVLGTGALLVTQRAQRLDSQRQRAALEKLHDDLRRELAEVRQRAEISPTLYLGTASDTDLVLDLDPWMQGPISVQPASYTISRP